MLMRVLPQNLVSGTSTSWQTEHLHGPAEFRVIEKAKFTMTLEVQQRYPQMPSVPELHMIIRMYRDTRLVEVLSYHGYTRSLPESTLPEAKQLQCNGKRHANLMLSDWLMSLKPAQYATDGTLSCT